MTTKKRNLLAGLVLANLALGAWIFLQPTVPPRSDHDPKPILPPGAVLDSYREVPVYENGPVVATSHGKHYAADGYYYGQKWQCVEYIKRFYHDAKGHSMPNGWGHARDFYDPEVAHGALNPKRGLVQFENGGTERPQGDDLLVFRTGTLGHVAIISKVSEKEIEVVQQNIHGYSRGRHLLSVKDGCYTIGEARQPAGWLRLP